MLLRTHFNPVQMVTEHAEIEALRTCLGSTDPIAKRMNSVFILKALHKEHPVEALEALTAGFVSDSVLLKHEIAYVMGQLGDPRANETLTALLRNVSEDPIVRHEAGEALAAIGSLSSLEVLIEGASDPCVEVAETCQLGVDRVTWLRDNPEPVAPELEVGDFVSVDPVPRQDLKVTDVEALAEILNGEGLYTLTERYKAMFGLRNNGSEEAVLALCAAFKSKAGALLKHEVAFVLGQMMHPASIPGLVEMVVDDTQHGMVRHEAAEALGAVAGEDEAILQLLRDFLTSDDQILSESCQVALDINDYWTTN